MRVPGFVVAGAGAVLLAVLVGCQSAGARRAAIVLPPLPPGGSTMGWSDGEIEAARTLYFNKCARCHKFHDPRRYQAADWNRWMTKMSHKAKLQPDQEKMLRQFLGLYRAAPPAAAPATQ